MVSKTQDIVLHQATRQYVHLSLYRYIRRHRCHQPLVPPCRCIGKNLEEPRLNRQHRHLAGRHIFEFCLIIHGRPSGTLLDHIRQVGQNRICEYIRCRKRQARRSRPCHELNDQYRIAAQCKEAVVSSNRIAIQQATPKLGQRPFDGAFRLAAGAQYRHRLGHLFRRDRKRLSIDLAIGCQRHGLNKRDGRRNHVIRKSFPKLLPDPGRRRC